MSGTFRETTRKSWFGRIASSFVGALTGLVLVAASVIGLFWNEGRAVQTAKSLAEGASAVVSVSSEAVDSANEGHFVHTTGMLAAGERPADPDFGISAEGVRLARSVEMYQWKESSHSETRKELGGSEETVTTYTYSRGWEDRAVDSGDFRQPGGHENPPMEISGETFQVPQAKLGAFTLNKTALDAMDDSRDLPLKAADLDAVRAAYGGTANVAIANSRIYLGADPSAPRVGDYRIAYQTVPLETVSIVARQAGGALEGYQTKAGDRLLLVAAGDVPAERMFADAVTENTILTWVFRLVGLVVMGVAFALILAPLGVVGDVVPMVGSIVRLGTGFVALVLMVALGSVTIALAWVWYRPLLALGILAVGAVIAFVLLRLRKGGTAAPAAA